MGRCIPIAAALGVVAVFAAGCSQPEEPLRVTGRPIVGGEADTNPAHMATVALTFGDAARFFCSGTLITETAVLTAGHCLDAVGDATSIVVLFGDSIWQPVDHRRATDGLIHPRYDPYNIMCDIALLRLESPAPAGITPIPHLPAALGLSRADEGATQVDFSGFGVDELGNSGIKLHVEDAIDVVCDGPGVCDGYVNPLMFGYDQWPGGPCSGDSGGPAYLVRDGTEYVAGATSYGDRRCSQYGASTTVDRFAAWIDEYVISENCQNATDDDFDGLTDCGDPECAQDPACPENCTNLIDDEPDGHTDCDDPDCALHPACLPDACQNAVEISCGDTIGADTRQGSYRFGSYGCLPSGTEDGPEMAFRLDAAAGTPVTAILEHGLGGDLDLFVLPPASPVCDTGTCLDSSFEAEPPERVDFIMPPGGVFLMVETYDLPAAFDLSVSCGNPVELCHDGADNDGDGDIDCVDEDCATDLICLGPASLSVSPQDLDITASQDAGDPAVPLTLTNSGGRTALFQIASSEAWIGPDPQDGVLKPLSSRAVLVRMAVGDLGPGVHAGELVVTAPEATGSPVTIPVSLELVPDRPVPAVSALQIEPRDQALRLTWTTPSDPIVHRIVIRRATGAPPPLPEVGELAYQGLGAELLDAGLQNGTTYCYSAFATDVSGRYADPATACAMPGENRPPPVPDPLSPADGAVLPGTPVLVASVVHDPEGEAVSYNFQILSEGGSVLLEGAEVQISSNRVSWAPQIDLQAGTVYLWQVGAADARGASSGYSVPRSFTLRSPSDAGADGGPPPDNPDGGCGCANTHGPSSIGFLLLGVGMLLAERRKRGACGHGW